MGDFNDNAPALQGLESTFAAYRESLLASPQTQVAMRFGGSAVTPATLSAYFSQVVGNPGLALEIVTDLDPVVTSTIYLPTSDQETTGWVDQGGGAFTFADIDDPYNSATYARNTAALASTSSLRMLQRGSAAYAALAATRILAVRVGAVVQLGANTANAARVTVEASLQVGTASVVYAGPRQSVARATKGQTTVPLSATLAQPVRFSDLGTFYFDPSTGVPWTMATINNMIAATADYGWGVTVRGTAAAGGFAVNATWIEVFTCTENRMGYYHSVTPPRAGWTRYTLTSGTLLSANTWYWLTVSCPLATQAAYARLPIIRAQKVQEPVLASGTGEHRQAADVALWAPGGAPYTLSTTPTNALGDTAAITRRPGEMFPILLETAGPTVEAQSQAYAFSDLLTIDSSTAATNYGTQITATAGTAYGGIQVPILWANPTVPPDRPLVVEVRSGAGAISGGGVLVATATIRPATTPPGVRNDLQAKPATAQHGITLLAPFDGGPFTSTAVQYHVIVKSQATPAKGWRMPRSDTRSDNIGSGPSVANIEGASQGGQTDSYFASGAAADRYDLPLALVACPAGPAGQANVQPLVLGELNPATTDVAAPEALPPRVALSWPASALTTAFAGYRVYRRRRGMPVRPWVLIGDITVPTGFTAATVEAQHTRFVDYEGGWSGCAPGEIGEEGWDYAFTVRNVNGLESFVGSSVDLDNDLTAGNDAWLVSNAAPYLNSPVRVTQSRRIEPESNQTIYRPAGHDHAVVRTVNRIPATQLRLGWKQAGYLTDEILRAQRAASLSGRQFALLEPTGGLWFGVPGPPQFGSGGKGGADMSSTIAITGTDSRPADYNLPAEVAFDGVNDYATSGSAAALNPASAPFSWFIAARFNDAAVTYLSKGNLGTSDGYGFRRSAAGTMQAFVDGASTSGGAAYATGTWFDGDLHVAVGTYDGATARLYLDGMLVNSTALVAGAVTNSVAFVAGANNGGASAFANAPTRAWGVDIGVTWTDAQAKAASRYLLGMFGYAMPATMDIFYDLADDRCLAAGGLILNDLTGTATTATLVGNPAMRGKAWSLSSLDRW